ncbi:MAG: DUF2220 family protein [Bacteroidales bacterium]|nr:DUF2220 family protein [Bacteroidales bacterium]
MITPQEIQQQCLNWWKNVLIANIEAVDFFPKEINRIGKITTKDLINKLPEYQKSLQLLHNNSKTNKNLGYSIIEKEQQFDKIGKQSVPEKIIIETLEDYLQVTGKKKEYQTFLKNYNLIISGLPLLKEWIIVCPQKLIEFDVWHYLLKVCKYFIENPKPNLYIRELPIKIHTKFIENNKSIIKELLDVIISEHINSDETNFEKRFNLKYDEPKVRFRILDKQIASTYFSEIDDLNIPISQLVKLKLPLKKVFVVENKMNVLTFPIITETIVIFGSGFGVENLKNVEWLNKTELFYWGDLDVQGFEILSQFKGYFPHAKSVLMDKATFETFFENDSGTSSKVLTEMNLSEEEKQLYEILKGNNWRLEQEKIPQEYVTDNLVNNKIIL